MGGLVWGRVRQVRLDLGMAESTPEPGNGPTWCATVPLTGGGSSPVELGSYRRTSDMAECHSYSKGHDGEAGII